LARQHLFNRSKLCEPGRRAEQQQHRQKHHRRQPTPRHLTHEKIHRNANEEVWISKEAIYERMRR
jgi:hypothetical protein